MSLRFRAALLACALMAAAVPAAPADDAPASPLGYYRWPALHDRTLVFTAEGDLWRVPIEGGVASRLTSDPGEESRAAISPDGRWVAFSGAYDGAIEAYVMPLAGGIPQRLTWDGLRASVAGWTPEGRVLYATRARSGMPTAQLMTVDPVTRRRDDVPLAQASQGAYLGHTLVFTRLDVNNSNTKRYRGGFLQQLWAWDGGRGEAHRLLPGDSAASRTPMVWQGRVYFVGDRDGTMNLWSVKPDGSDATQLTFHHGFDVLGASLSNGRIAYQLGADLHVFDLATKADALVPIRLGSDLDQSRERWVKKPMDYATTLHLSPSGDRVVATARGQVWVLPVEQGRIVEASRRPGVRYRQARFLDAKTVLALSDESGEVEFWTLPANGVGTPKQVTRDATILRWDGVPSPDGTWIASPDKDQVLTLVDAASGVSKRIDTAATGDFQDLEWSPDSRWLAYVRPADDFLLQVWIYDTKTGSRTAVTSDRTDSYTPAWSPDGRWLWFLSDRHFETVVRSMWGSRQPEPFFDKSTRIYGVALRDSFRSPFEPQDELTAGDAKADDKKKDSKSDAGGKPGAIALDRLASRLVEVPVDPGNYGSLATDGKRLYWLDYSTEVEPKKALRSLAIDDEGDDPTTVMSDVSSYELSADTKKLLVRKKDNLYVFDAGAKAPSELDKAQVPTGKWAFAFDPRIEWRQMFTEAWRLERDYFYDTKMHGADWDAIRKRYQPLADRVTDRAELADVFQQMVGELTALHMYVYGGDFRKGSEPPDPATLGGTLVPDERAGGWRIVRIPRTDPEWPGEAAPLARPGLDVREGDVITMVNGHAAADVVDLGQLLRNQADRPVLMRIARDGRTHDVLVKPVSPGDAAELRYRSWEYERRMRVDSLSQGRVGYVHLRAMSAEDIDQFVREYYPVFQREGLVVDVRNNNGGNIDAWVLSRLMRKNWMWWQPRVGAPIGNMTFAFRGRMVVLVNERTVSDGEAFAAGFRALGLGKVVGTRTLGGEIWLSSNNFLVDKGIATAAETGVFGLDGTWLIENHGVDPDIVVDNLPRATYDGGDAQLDTAVRTLLDDLKQHPVPPIERPKYPVKARR